MENRKCNFDVGGCCYALVCYTDIQCKCKDSKGNVVCMATIGEIKERSAVIEKIQISVMQPTVINEEDGSSPGENVASEGLDTEQSVILPKI